VQLQQTWVGFDSSDTKHLQMFLSAGVMYSMSKAPSTSKFSIARGIFLKHGGILRMSEALDNGVDRTVLYSMRDAGMIKALARGLYRLADLPPLAEPDLVILARRVKSGVVCLTSALAFHGITTQVPHQIDLALKRGTQPPEIAHPPVQLYWFSEPCFSMGVEVHARDGADIRVYNPEKTLADCFKYRHKLGIDLVLQALQMWNQTRRRHIEELLACAEVCRVGKIIRPYLKVLISRY
jgi:predicted transcriptional regulator of viral defense system